MSDIGHNNPPLDPKEAIERNINRKKSILDREPQIYKDIPLPSWIELSLIDVCNRDCSFCPKSDSSIAPNTYNKMEFTLIDKMIEDLQEINFDGSFTFCGYGEPLLHPHIAQITKKIGEFWSVEIVTNGDPLNKKNLRELYYSKVSKIVVSMYDGFEQIEKFEKIIREADVPRDFVILRDRWITGDEFSEYITNRAGTVKSGNQTKVEDLKDKKCFYPAYHTQIDWNGDIFLCPHDWQRRNPMGNLMQKKFFEIWTGSLMIKYRKMLFSGKREAPPCSSCNCHGKVHGSKHHLAWEKSNKL
jgi:radical SAM protein with 4Fe4S-binding SPASM domain